MYGQQYPQYNQYAQPMAAPNVQFGQVPQMNNFPVQGQPVNTTQSGIPFMQLRQDLISRIQQNANSDILASTVFTSAAGPNNAWNTAYLDKLINTLQMTIDFMWRQNPQADLTRVYQEAVNEVYSCAWANIATMYPDVLRDPNVQRMQGLINQWRSVAEQRYTQFAQLGLLNNNPVANVQPFATPSFQQGFPQQYNPQQYNTGNMQSTYFNKPMQPMQNGVIPFNPQPQQPTMNGLTANAPSPFQSAPRPGYPNQNSQSINSGNSQMKSIAQKQAEIQKQLETWTGEVDKYGFPIEGTEKTPQPQEPVQHVFPGPTGTNTTPTNMQEFFQARIDENNAKIDKFDKALEQANTPLTMQLGSINQVPEKRSPFAGLQQPHEVRQDRMSTEGYQVIEYDTPKLQPTESIPSKGITFRPGEVIDMTDKAAVTALFSRAWEDEVKLKENEVFIGPDGLLEDEERVLTDKERRALFNRGVRFEPPFTSPITAHPMHNALHAVLLKNGMVRQIVTPLDEGVDMRLSAHDDILAPLRADKSVQRDPNAKKYISGTVNNITTSGGVIYDRFALSKQVLHEGIKTALEVEDKEERDILIGKAFERFDEQAKKDLYNDKSGYTKYKLENPDEDIEGDEDFKHPIFDDKEQTDLRVEQANRSIPTDEVEDILVVDGVNGASTALAIDVIANNQPAADDHASIGTFQRTKVLHVFNNPKELELVKEELADFFWKEVEEDTEEVQDRLTARHFATVLRERREYIPTFLWEKLNTMLTDYAKDAIRYIVGVEGANIDSFADDYEDLYNMLLEAEETKFAHLDNFRIGVSVADIMIANQARCLHESDEYIAEGLEDVNPVTKRALTAVLHDRVWHVPTTSKTAGLTTNLNTVTEDTDYGIWKQCKVMIEDMLAARLGRTKYKFPLQGGYVKFADGNLYRVFPRVGDLTNWHTRTRESDGSIEFFPSVTLVKLPNNI